MHRSKYAMRFLISLGTKKQPTPAHPVSAVNFFRPNTFPHSYPLLATSQTLFEIFTFIILIGHQSDLF